MEKIKKRLQTIYEKDYNEVYEKLEKILEKYKDNKVIIEKKKKHKQNKEEGGKHFSKKDSILITYGDSIINEGERPLVSLHKFLKKNVEKSISSVHILPFFPYSSDDGFSVIDYRKVDEDLGEWKDIEEIGKDYRLMADLVINHMSAKSVWFNKFLEGDEKYKNYFISFDEEVDTNEVFRPRISPLLTPFETKWGKRYVWTTFSSDQIDLNFANPEVLLEMVDILLYYVTNYIEIIRLDAIGFLWKELGTNCFHLKKTHEIVKLFRDILDEIAEYVVLITETNVPYKDNISYFGEGDEADMVYQFSYPPLVLDSFLRTDTTYLQKLFNRIEGVDNENLFFNFLASHDGIGVLSARDYLSDLEFDSMLEQVKSHNGYVSYKNTKDGKVAYEMNINYFDAINNPNLKKDETDEGRDEEVKRFMASQSVIVLSKGVPGIYIHSLLGSRNWNKGVEESGINRRVNREKLDYKKLEKELDDKESRRSKVLKSYKKLLKIRSEEDSFNPYLSEKVIESDKRLLILKKDNGKKVIINVSGDEVKIDSGEKIREYEVRILDD